MTRRPLLAMTQERRLPYSQLFHMSQPELFEAVLEVEGVLPWDVRPFPEHANACGRLRQRREARARDRDDSPTRRLSLTVGAPVTVVARCRDRPPGAGAAGMRRNDHLHDITRGGAGQPPGVIEQRQDRRRPRLVFQLAGQLIEVVSH